MEIITSEKRSDFLRYIRSIRDKKVVGTVDIVSVVHEGHRQFIKEMKKYCDISVVEYSKFFLYGVNYFREGTFSGDGYDFDLFIKDISPVADYVDYVIESPVSEKIINQVYYLEQYRDKFLQYAESINWPGTFANALNYQVHSEVVESCTKAFVSPKNIILNLAQKKILPKDVIVYDPEIIWFIARDQKFGHSLSRTSSDKIFGAMIRDALSEVKSGKGELKDFEKIVNSYWLGTFERDEEKRATIVDLKTGERLKTITNNCVIIFGTSKATGDFLFVKDGEIFY